MFGCLVQSKLPSGFVRVGKERVITACEAKIAWIRLRRRAEFRKAVEKEQADGEFRIFGVRFGARRSRRRAIKRVMRRYDPFGFSDADRIANYYCDLEDQTQTLLRSAQNSTGNSMYVNADLWAKLT